MTKGQDETRIRLGDRRQRQPRDIVLRPNAAQRQDLAKKLGLLSLRTLTLPLHLHPQGSADWLLTGRLGATVVQPCVVTLEPVTTRIDQPVTRRYLADYRAPDATETEVPEDDSAEPLPEILDLMALIAEELSLALPLYPRAPGAELGEVQALPPGAEPIKEVRPNPFAGLAALRTSTPDQD